MEDRESNKENYGPEGLIVSIGHELKDFNERCRQSSAMSILFNVVRFVQVFFVCFSLVLTVEHASVVHTAQQYLDRRVDFRRL
jgi:hypothetical protein